MVEAAISASKVAGSARISRMATAGRDQDNGRVAALLFGVCRTSLQCAFEIGEGGRV